MIYLDNAATGGEKPRNVLTAVRSSIELCANAGRGAHRLAISCLAGVQACRSLLAKHFACPEPDRVIFTKNCTEALNIAILGGLEAGDHVVTTCLEHNSVLRPLYALKSKSIIDYDVCPLTNGAIDPSILSSLVKPTTKAVIITAASNVTGYAPKLSAIRARLPERVLLIVDGAQAGGHININMDRAGIDALCLAGHKGLLGIQGSGALLLSQRFTPKPILYGGTGSLSYAQEMPDFLPDALESGTLNYPAILSVLEGVNYLTVHQDEIAEHCKHLTASLLRGLKKLPEATPYSQPNACGIVSLRHRRFPSEFLSMLLSKKYDIATRGGLHCAPLAHQALQTDGEGLLRISFGHQNTEKDVEALLSALSTIFTE